MRSSSMQALDFELEGRAVDRLTAIKIVGEKFVIGNDTLNGRFNDLIGPAYLRRLPSTVSPPRL